MKAEVIDGRLVWTDDGGMVIDRLAVEPVKRLGVLTDLLDRMVQEAKRARLTPAAKDDHE